MNQIQIILSCMVILAHSCSYLYNNTIFLTGTMNEKINIPLNSIFHNTDYDKLTLKQTLNSLQITSPIQKLKEVSNGGLQNARTLSSKLKKTTTSRDPLNHLTMLAYNGYTYNIEYNTGIYETLPQISNVLSCSQKEKSKCYEVVRINQLIIVDCDDESQKSYLIIKDQINTQYLDVETPISQFRKLEQLDDYMFRGTANKISLYVEEEKQLKFLNSIDEEILKTLFGKDTFKLSIKDFQIHTNGQLSILNESGDIIIIEYKNDQWVKINFISTNLKDVQTYDYDIYKNTYAIISKNQISYKEDQKEQQKIEVLEQNDSDKIHITKKGILFLQNNFIKVLNEKLEKINNLELEEQNNSIITNPYAEGFIVIGNAKFYAYTIDGSYSLQLQIDKEDNDYQKASLVQQVYPKSCEITIFYKSLPYGYSKIFQSQYSQGFFSQAVYIDNKALQINPIFQGSNLKYQFTTNSLVSTKVEKCQNVQFNDLGETKNLQYRKILTEQRKTSFYLIQQDNNLQVKGYKCDGTLEITCQKLFVKDNFIKLVYTSQQLWWTNQGQVFFASYQDKVIDIYYSSSETQTFESLTKITLESNVKQIVTDGFHLFVLIEEFIKTYEITKQNQAKLTVTFDVVAKNIYATEYLKNQLFIEDGITLYLYDIEYNMQTLIWFTKTDNDELESNLIIFENHFVRLARVTNAQLEVVKVFNYENKRNIFLQKQIQFNYLFNTALSTINQSFENNLFYIAGQTTQTQKYIIQVYKIQSSSQDTQFYQIDTTSTAKFSAAGNFILITDVPSNDKDTVLQNYYINGELLIQNKFNQNYEQISYTLEVLQEVQVSNDFSEKITQQIPINVVNRGDKILPLNDKIDLKYQEDNEKTHCLNLGQTWYSGQVFNVSVVSTSTKIQFIQSLTLKKESLDFSSQIQEFNKDQLVQLMPNKLKIIKKEDLSFKEFALEETYNFISILLIAGQNIYVQSTNQAQIWLRVIQCKDQQDCKLLDNKLEVKSNIKKLYLHQNNMFFYIENKVNVYDTKGQETNLEKFELIQSFLQYVFLKQIEFTHLKDNIYQFISVDNWGNPEFQMRVIDKASTENYFVRFLIDSLIGQEHINVQATQLAAGFVLRKDEITIIFKNSASYSFNYQVDCTRNKLCEITKFKFDGLYQQYKDWEILDAYPSFQQNENILQLIYYAKNHYELFIYDMETPSSNQRPKTIIARVMSPEIKQLYWLKTLVYSYNGQLQLLTSAQDQTKLQLFNLLRSNQICTNQTEFNDHVKFALSNTDSQITTEPQVLIKEDLDPSTDNDGFPVWAIILIILTILLSGGGLFIYLRQRKNRIQNENQLLAQ